MSTQNISESFAQLTLAEKVHILDIFSSALRFQLLTCLFDGSICSYHDDLPYDTQRIVDCVEIAGDVVEELSKIENNFETLAKLCGDFMQAVQVTPFLKETQNIISRSFLRSCHQHECQTSQEAQEIILEAIKTSVEVQPFENSSYLDSAKADNTAAKVDVLVRHLAEIKPILQALQARTSASQEAVPHPQS